MTAAVITLDDFKFSEYVVLSKVVLIDVKAFRKVPPELITQLYEKFNTHKKPLVFQESIATKYPYEIKNKLLKGEDSAVDLELFLNRPLTAEEEATVASISRYAKMIENLLGMNSSKYPFQDVPAGFRVTSFVINKSSIRRSSGNYTIGHKGLQTIWTACAAYWRDTKGMARPSNLIGINASGYKRDVEIYDTYIKIGCQRVERYELEQLAMHLDWSFT